MASYYFRNTGDTNRGTASNRSATDWGWATGAVPTSTYDAFFSNQSWSCVVDTSNRVCKTLDFTKGTGYTGTLTMTKNITVSWNVTLNGAMTYTGAWTLAMSESWTMASNWKTITWWFSFIGTTKTYTVLWNMIVNGMYTQAWTTGMVVNRTTNETITCNWGFSNSMASACTWTVKIVLAWWTCSSWYPYRLNTEVAGDITITTFYLSTCTFTYISWTPILTNALLFLSSWVTVNTGSSMLFNTVYWQGGNTLNADLYTTTLFFFSTTASFAWTGKVTTSWTAWSITNLTIQTNATGTITVPAAITVTGTFTFAANFVVTCNWFSFILNGNIITSGSANMTWTTTITYTWTWSWTGSSAPTTTTYAWWLNNLTINTAWTLTLWANVIAPAILTYTAWTVVTTGNTLWVNISSTLNTDWIVWNNVSFIPNNAASIAIILSSLLTANTIYFWWFASTFSSGSAGWTCNNLNMMTYSNASARISLSTLRTYTVNQSINACGDALFYPTINSNTGWVKTTLIYNWKYARISYIKVTDVDSTGGKTIYYADWIFSNVTWWTQYTSDMQPKQEAFISLDNI